MLGKNSVHTSIIIWDIIGVFIAIMMAYFFWT